MDPLSDFSAAQPASSLPTAVHHHHPSAGGGGYAPPAISRGGGRYSPMIPEGVPTVNGGGTPGYPATRPDSPTADPQQIPQPLELFTDFTRPDGQRTRPLLVDGKRLYVDEHYISVWSPVLRAWCIECPDRELILANVQYEHVLEMLLAIHPTYKEVDEQTVHVLLPLAFDYQMDGLLHRCECFLVANKLPFLEKVWLADRFQLNRLLALLLRELRPNAQKLDLTGPRYAGLSDRVKVMLLERMHGSPAPEELPEPPVDMEHLLSPSELNFTSVKAKTGRAYHVNPYYVAAWSTLFQERLSAGIAGGGMPDDDDLIYCPCSGEELKYFLMSIYPPQLRITESNIAPVLMAACKLESHGLLRKCATILLSPHTQLSVFVRLSLLDRCRLQELLEQCLMMVNKWEYLVEMSQQQTYECLSVRAKATMMDRFAQLIHQQQSGSGTSNWLTSMMLPSSNPSMPLAIHLCARCKSQSGCAELTWQCPQCKTYTSPAKQTASNGHEQQQPGQQRTMSGGGGGGGGRHQTQQQIGAGGGPAPAVAGARMSDGYHR